MYGSKDVQHKFVKMSCASTQLKSLLFYGPHSKLHVVRGFIKNYHLRLDHTLGNGKCSIRWIPYAYIFFTNMLYRPWVIGRDPTRQTLYQPVGYCTYWPVLGFFKNCSIIQFTNKTTIDEDFDAVHKFLLDGISDDMSALVQNGKYGTINTVDSTIMGYYVIKLL